MRAKILKPVFVLYFLSIYLSVSSQNIEVSINTPGAIIDSLKNIGVIYDNSHKSSEIILSPDQAVRFLQNIIRPQYWKNRDDPFRLNLNQLIFESSHPRFDSTAHFLKQYAYDSLDISWDKFYIWEPLSLKIPVIGAPESGFPPDTIIKADNNIVKSVDDSIINNSLIIQNTLEEKKIARFKDTTILVVTDTLNEVTSDVSGFPFRYFTMPYQSDSIRVAVESLLKYLEERDSIIINFTGLGKEITPVWINSKSDNMIRFWLKNVYSDSVTVWIGNPSRNTIGLYLEQDINFRRLGRQGHYSDAKVNIKSLDNTKLLEIQKIVVKPQYWKFRSEASFFLNQSSLNNWVKGGESSISTALDITGYADYNNKIQKLSSKNFARLSYGYITSGKDGIRKNLDLLETNSKLNHKAFGKFDFSGILLFKTQLAPGYNYPNDSVEVSKFFNPATLTIGLGLDYKPDKSTSLNFSPLSYKGTFVTDTANIDQTRYGISHDRKSKNEPGASFMVTNEFKPFKSVTIINRLQLFTNYINNIQNVDIDWEVIATASLNWFTDVRFNTHLIFDDDTKTMEYDKDNNPILRPDGIQKKTARAQFKEMLGFSLIFRF